MGAFILVAVVIGVLFVVASGVWVAVALVKAISTPRGDTNVPGREDDETGV